MKNVSFLLIICIFCGFSILAKAADSADAVTAKDGKVYTMQEGKTDLLTDDLKFPNDILISTNCTFKVGKGKERQLADGQILKSDGWLLSPDGSVMPVFDHVAMSEGRVVVVRDGESRSITETYVFPNKMAVDSDGTCAYPDGRRTRLMDGQLFLLDGTPILSKDTISMKNGRVVVQKEGKLIPLSGNQIMAMNDGTVVHSDGLIQKADGTTFRINEDQTILVDGALVR